MIQWSDLDLAEMSTVASEDINTLREWWYENMPPSLHHFIDILRVERPQDIPTTEEELIALLEELGISEEKKKRRFAGLFVAGSLLFFSGIHYYNQNRGRLKSPRGVVLSLAQRVGSGMRGTCNSLREGETSFDGWQSAMAEQTINAHFASTLLGNGFDLSEEALAQTSSLIREQMDYLSTMVDEVDSGARKMDGRLCNRLRLYAHSSYSNYGRMLTFRMTREGFEEYRSVLNPAEHCDMCVSEADRGYVPVGMLTPIGGRTCLGNCKCHYEFRNGSTGEVYTG